MDIHNNLSAEWLTNSLRDRLQSRIAAGHPWKQLLQTASEATVRDVFQTLQAYTLLWTTLETGKGRIFSFQHRAVLLELCDAAEGDLERGLSFIREVEKGSHMRNVAVLAFRPEAIKALCGLCRDRIDMLKPRREEDEDEDDGNGSEEKGEEKKEEGGEEKGGAGALEAAKHLIGTVYHSVEPQLKTRFQSLVHQHKKKTRGK